MINRNDPDFRAKLLRMLNPENVLDYGQSVDVDAVRELYQAVAAGRYRAGR